MTENTATRHGLDRVPEGYAAEPENPAEDVREDDTLSEPTEEDPQAGEDNLATESTTEEPDGEPADEPKEDGDTAEEPAGDEEAPRDKRLAKARAEAAKYRTQLREVEAELEQALYMVEHSYRKDVEVAASHLLGAPAMLWTIPEATAQTFMTDGRPDDAKIRGGIAELKERFGNLPSPVRSYTPEGANDRPGPGKSSQAGFLAG